VFKPGTKEYSEIAKLKLADSPTYAHPVVAGNRIFMKDADALIMWLVE